MRLRGIIARVLVVLASLNLVVGPVFAGAQSINLKAQGNLAEAADKAKIAKDAIAATDTVAQTGKTATQTFNILGNQPWGEAFQTGLFGPNLTLAHVFEGALDGAINTGLHSAFYGSNFADGFKSTLIRNVVALGLADSQIKIGDAGLKEGSLPHALLHGAAGCAAAKLQGARCAAGAAGAISQSFLSGLLDQTGSDLSKFQEQQLAYFVGAVGGYLFSEGDPENVYVAANVARSGIANNRQLHRELAALLSDRLGTEITDDTLDDPEALAALTAEQRAVVARACAIERCYLQLSRDNPNWAGRVALARLYSENAAQYDAIWDAQIGSLSENGAYRHFYLDYGYGAGDALADIEASGLVNIPSARDRLLYLALWTPDSADAFQLNPAVFDAFTQAATQITDPDQLYTAIDATLPPALRDYLNAVHAHAVSDFTDFSQIIETRLRALRLLGRDGGGSGISTGNSSVDDFVNSRNSSNPGTNIDGEAGNPAGPQNRLFNAQELEDFAPTLAQRNSTRLNDGSLIDNHGFVYTRNANGSVTSRVANQDQLSQSGIRLDFNNINTLDSRRNQTYEPRTLNEQLARQQVISNPSAGLGIGQANDARFTFNGFEKQRQNVNGVEIHYQYNPSTGEVLDVKITD